jgi:hypothetical protein
MYRAILKLLAKQVEAAFDTDTMTLSMTFSSQELSMVSKWRRVHHTSGRDENTVPTVGQERHV